MNVHIALVGGQPMPVYIGIKEIPADKVILIHSVDSKRDAEQIRSHISAVTELRQFDPVDYIKGYEEAEKLVFSYPDDHITVNVSSGTKPWAIAFALLSTQHPNVTILYVDQNCVFYDYTNRRQWNSSVSLDTGTILSYNKQKSESHVILDEYTEEDLSVLKRVKQIRAFNIDVFNKLTIPNKSWKNQLQEKMLSSYVLPNSSSVNWNKNLNTVSLQILHKGTSKKETLTSPHVFHIVFNSGWFEYEVAVMLSKWKYAKEIWLNTVFPYNTKNPKNEIDVIVNTGNKLLFVECKTQIFDNTDIDKFRTAVRNYGGMGCKAIFITKESMKPEAKEKCNDSGILTFSMTSSSNLMSNDKALSMLLESELFNINTK